MLRLILFSKKEYQMKSRSIMASLAGLALVATPVVAQAANTAPIRASAAVGNSEGMSGGSSGFLALVGFLGAMVTLAILASGDNNPVSV
jgi:hypothetical protein